MKTIGHHTCRKDGGREYVLNNAPFLSEFEEGGKKPFLGEGFYYWDYDINQAKSWGKSHYRNSYYIFQAVLEVEDDIYLDLAGNRQQMVYFEHLMERFEKNGIDIKKWKIGAFIEFMKVFRKKDYNAFPFEVIRAEDYYTSNGKRVYFNEKQNFTNLNARFVICFFVTTDLPLQNRSIVYESN